MSLPDLQDEALRSLLRDAHEGEASHPYRRPVRVPKPVWKTSTPWLGALAVAMGVWALWPLLASKSPPSSTESQGALAGREVSTSGVGEDSDDDGLSVSVTREPLLTAALDPDEPLDFLLGRDRRRYEGLGLPSFEKTPLPSDAALLTSQ